MVPSSKKVPLLLLVTSQTLAALEVAPGSPCATYCLDSPAGNEWNSSDSTTNTDDISCHDDSYASTATGQKFVKCISCMQTSVRAYEGESDLDWFIYNLRYTISTCVFSKPRPALDNDSGSPCNTDDACGPFKDPLTGDGPSPNPNTTWDYCGASNGTFMGPNLEPCISCLRSTENQTYIANFVTALEAGCLQSPYNVTMLGLSGTLFTRDAVNITDPNADTKSQPSQPLSLSAIIGIVVGIVLIFGFAVCLFVIYYTRQRPSSHLENPCGGEDSDSPKTLVDPWGYVITQPRRFPHFHDKDNTRDTDQGRSDETNGDYYNRLEEAAHTGRIRYAHDPRCPIQGPDNIMPTHQAYLPNTMSRRDVKSKVAARAMSPPRPSHRQRPSTPDSFVTQAYMAAVEDASRLASTQPIPTRQPSSYEPASASTTSDAATGTATASTTPQSGWTSRLSSIVMPSMPRIRILKRYAPPRLALQPSTPAGDSGERQLRISPPLMHDDPRFQDRPLGAGIVVYDTRDRPPTPKSSNKYAEYTEVPLRSGKSILYGM